MDDTCKGQTRQAKNAEEQARQLDESYERLQRLKLSIRSNEELLLVFALS